MKVDLEKYFVSLSCFLSIIIRTHSQIYKQLVHLAVPVQNKDIGAHNLPTSSIYFFI